MKSTSNKSHDRVRDHSFEDINKKIDNAFEENIKIFLEE